MSNSISQGPTSTAPDTLPAFSELQEEPREFLTTPPSSLHAPLPFFNHRIDVHSYPSTPAEHRAESARYANQAAALRPDNISEGNKNTPRAIRVLEARANVHQILAQDLEEEIPPQTGTTEHAQPPHDLDPELPSLELIPPPPPMSSEASTPASDFSPSPTTVTSSRLHRSISRTMRRHLSIATKHEEQAALCMKEAKKTARFSKTVRSAGDKAKANTLDEQVQKLKNTAAYHTAVAREARDKAYTIDTSSPGAYHNVPLGNYEIEYPTVSFSFPVRAKKMINPGHDLITLQRARPEKITQGKVLSETSKKMTAAEEQLLKTPKKDLPKAKRVSVKEVQAEPPRRLNIRTAKARFSPHSNGPSTHTL